MKKIVIILGIMLLSLTFNSCEKDEEKSKSHYKTNCQLEWEYCWREESQKEISWKMEDIDWTITQKAIEDIEDKHKVLCAEKFDCIRIDI